MTRPTNDPTDQTEFVFSADFRRPRGLAAPTRRGAERAPSPLAGPPRRRRGLVPPGQRLPISPEAFARPEGERSRRAPIVAASLDGLLEAIVAILATMAFGLAWAAYELDFELDFDFRTAASGHPGGSLAGEYALIVPEARFGLAGIEEAEWTTTYASGLGGTPIGDASAR